MLRAELRPSGFLQTLLAERIIDLAWKLRRSCVAQTEIASRLLDEDLHQHVVAVQHGAYDGPYLPLTGAQIVADGVEGGEGLGENAAYLRLDLYADRLQRAMLGALMRLRREQQRAAAAGGPSDAPADVEVELGEDQAENNAMKNKATAGEPSEEDFVNLRSFIHYPWGEKAAGERSSADNANSQNKATAGPEAPAPAGAETTVASGG
jgi:hypothetical protein